MTKAEQARVMAWRLRILQWAEGEPRQVARTYRHFGTTFSIIFRNHRAALVARAHSEWAPGLQTTKPAPC
jgi:hypothetical protein